EAINWVMARYAQLVPSDVLLARAGHEAHPTERAQLCGLRHALVSETANGKGWNENAVKQLTGDTKMSARYMRQDFFEFSITHKLSVCTNNRPEVREHSHAFWRRVNLVNWPVQLPEAEKDSGLLDKLRGEAAGILAWIVRGAVAWVREGLAAPEAVKRATSEYRSETDALGMFLEERTQRLDGTRTPASALYKAWAAWVEARGEKAGGGSQTTFGERMAARGLTRVKSSGLMFYRGLALRPQQEREAEDDDRDGDRDGWAEPSMSELSANSQAESATGIVRDSCAPIATPTREPENISHASVADSTRTRALALENEDPFLRVGIIQPTIPNYPCDLGTSDNSQDKPTISPDCQPSLSTLPSPPTEPIEGLDDWEDL
ncbi:MAG: phage/plasmid primase, P4 family, partial [Deltaproteobacteria bacterium]|nr:phage/plasmid primase, P4 family [Deltaproteobacteria bacterium]